jgi:hypothetical protein
VEERSEFRSQTVASASRLSIAGEEGFPSPGLSLVVVGRVLEMLGSRGVSVNEIGPACLAPSHPFHVMPSRITRNSHRPRASDRTMVDLESSISLAALANPTPSSSSAEKLMRTDNEPNFSTELETTVGWISRKNLNSGRGRSFFLDIPFYRTH